MFEREIHSRFLDFWKVESSVTLFGRPRSYTVKTSPSISLQTSISRKYIVTAVLLSARQLHSHFLALSINVIRDNLSLVVQLFSSPPILPLFLIKIAVGINDPPVDTFSY